MSLNKGTLLSIPNESMNSFVGNKIRTWREYWTGGFKSTECPSDYSYSYFSPCSMVDVWRWSGSDDKVSYTSWDWEKGQPDNQEGAEDRITINSDGKWNDLSGDAERRFICSKKASPGIFFISCLNYVLNINNHRP